MRFRIRTLLLIIVFAAIAITAFLHASRAWLIVVSTIVFATFLYAVLVALLGTKQGRGFAIGYSIGGLGYVCLVGFSPPNAAFEISGSMASSWLVEQLYYFIVESTYLDSEIDGLFEDSEIDGLFEPPELRTNPVYFSQIGHSVSAAIIGCIAGVVASHLYRRRCER